MEINSYLKKQMQKRMWIMEYKKVTWYLIDESAERFTYLNNDGSVLQYIDGKYIFVPDKFTPADAIWNIETFQYRIHMQYGHDAFR